MEKELLRSASFMLLDCRKEYRGASGALLQLEEFTLFLLVGAVEDLALAVDDSGPKLNVESNAVFVYSSSSRSLVPELGQNLKRAEDSWKAHLWQKDRLSSMIP
eukprot:gene18539-20402_t